MFDNNGTRHIEDRGSNGEEIGKLEDACLNHDEVTANTTKGIVQKHHTKLLERYVPSHL